MKLDPVISSLDKIASTIQEKGLVKEAEEIDVVSNTLEKMAKERLKQNTRPSPIFNDSSTKVTDDKDHFPIDTIERARNALARVNQYTAVPSWYKGTLEQLKAKVRSAVHAKYPSIEISDK
jgi:hypothetical protein